MTKILVNECYGGFVFSKDFKKSLDSELKQIANDAEWGDYNARTNEKLIEKVEKFDGYINGSFSEIIIETIPDNATDWMLVEYDGSETVYYVLNGKIFCGEHEDDED